jgi:hypothetical protein
MDTKNIEQSIVTPLHDDQPRSLQQNFMRNADACSGSALAANADTSAPTPKTIGAASNLNN